MTGMPFLMTGMPSRSFRFGAMEHPQPASKGSSQVDISGNTGIAPGGLRPYLRNPQMPCSPELNTWIDTTQTRSHAIAPFAGMDSFWPGERSKRASRALTD